MGTPNVNNFFTQGKAYAKTLDGYTEKTKVMLNEDNSISIDFDGDGKIDKTVKNSEYASDTFKTQNNDLVNLKFKLKNLEYDKTLAKDETAKAAIDKQIIETQDKIKNSGATADEIKKADNEVALRDLLEQKYVLEFSLLEAEKNNNANEIASYKNQIARLQIKIDKLQPSKEEVKAINDDISGPGNLPCATDDSSVADEPLKEKPKTLIGSDFKVSNAQNVNGTIDGTIEDMKFNEDEKPTSITIKSKKSGNEFTYVLDEKTGKYVNTKEPNKYYNLTESFELVRDNKAGQPARPVRPANEIAEVVVTAKGPDKVRLAEAKKLGVGYTGAGNLYKKTDDKGNTTYYEWNAKDGKFVENKNIVLVTPPSSEGKNYLVRTKTNEGFNEHYYANNGTLQQTVTMDANRNSTGRIEYSNGGKEYKVYDSHNKVTKETVNDGKGNITVRDYVQEAKAKKQRQAQYGTAKQAVIDGMGKTWYGQVKDVGKLGNNVVSALKVYFNGNMAQVASYIAGQTGNQCKLSGGSIVCNSIGGVDQTTNMIYKLANQIKGTNI